MFHHETNFEDGFKLKCIALSFMLYDVLTSLMLRCNQIDANKLQLQLQLALKSYTRRGRTGVMVALIPDTNANRVLQGAFCGSGDCRGGI